MDTEHIVSGTVFYTFVSTLLRRTMMDTGFGRGTRTVFMNFFPFCPWCYFLLFHCYPFLFFLFCVVFRKYFFYSMLFF
ncbi:uncharacterized protein DS421_5g158310 [Arachis hypogaea]|nr:uncharacterized protein DS421_5g158310 [Arachis hypogaea]